MTECEAFTLLLWDCFVPRNDVPLSACPSLRGTKQSHITYWLTDCFVPRNDALMRQSPWWRCNYILSSHHCGY